MSRWGRKFRNPLWLLGFRRQLVQQRIIAADPESFLVRQNRKATTRQIRGFQVQ